MRRRVSAARVKSNRSYTVEQAAELVGRTEQTVRAWIKRGLRAMTARRPTLIHGHDLKAWVQDLRTPKAGPLAIGLFFCLGCKGARAPALGMVDYLPISDRHGRLVALCGECVADCSRIVSVAALPAWSAFCDVSGSTPAGTKSLSENILNRWNRL